MLESHLTRRHHRTLDAIIRVIRAFQVECAENAVATVSEGHLKVIAMRALLTAGFKLLEGSAVGNVTKCLSMTDGRIGVEMVARRTPEELSAHERRRATKRFMKLAKAGNPQLTDDLLITFMKEGGLDVPSDARRTSADIRVCDPNLVIELQARSIYGSQDTLFGKNVIDDLQRLADGRADVLIIACDRPIYDALRGNRRDPRGRKALLAPDLAARIFPGTDTLPVDAVMEVNQGISGSPFGDLQYCGCRAVAGTAVERVVIAIWTATPTTTRCEPETANE
jgi:hypothetical protein